MAIVVLLKYEEDHMGDPQPFFPGGLSLLRLRLTLRLLEDGSGIAQLFRTISRKKVKAKMPAHRRIRMLKVGKKPNGENINNR
jgi:hypothetical protein